MLEGVLYAEGGREGQVERKGRGKGLRLARKALRLGPGDVRMVVVVLRWSRCSRCSQARSIWSSRCAPTLPPYGTGFP